MHSIGKSGICLVALPCLWQDAKNDPFRGACTPRLHKIALLHLVKFRLKILNFADNGASKFVLVGR